MKNKVILGAGMGILVLVMGLTGCSAVKAQTTEPTTTSVQTASVQPISVNVNGQQGIWVSGTGKVAVTPDIAILNLGVSCQMASVAEAQKQASSAMEKVMQALSDSGVAKNDIKTQNYNIYQMNRWDDSSQQEKVTGYNVSNMVEVKVRALDKVGEIIDAVVLAGGDFIRINGINFSVEKPEQYFDQAREHAMQDAKNNAEALAKLSNVTLGKATYIVENPNTQSSYYYRNGYNSAEMAIAVPMATSAPISAGETEIVLNVTVAYAIQ